MVTSLHDSTALMTRVDVMRRGLQPDTQILGNFVKPPFQASNELYVNPCDEQALAMCLYRALSQQDHVYAKYRGKFPVE